MRLWTPLPGELLKGFVGRLRRDNLIEGALEQDSLFRIGRGYGRESSYSTHEIEAALEARGWGAKEIVCRHTLVPFSKCVGKFDWSESSAPSFGEIRYLPFAIWAGRSAWLCRDCVAEDRDQHGFAIWHRCHQVPGLSWCVRHFKPLSEFKHANAFEHSPSSAMRSSVDASALSVKSCLKSAVVLRYSEIVQRLLREAQGPIHSTAAAWVIRNRAAARGWKVMPWGRDTYLSDAAAEAAPEPWLAANFPGSEKKRPNCFSGWMDNAGHARTKPVGAATFALALALLWDDPADATAAFLGANAEVLHVRLRELDKSTLPSEAVRRHLWLSHRGCHTRIARATGISYDRTKRSLDALGLVAVGEKSFARIEAAGRQFLQGRSLAAVCRSVGVERHLVEAFVRAAETSSKVMVSP